MTDDVNKIVSKLLSDEAFATSLSANPNKALADAKIPATKELISALNGVDPKSLRQLAQAFESSHAAV
jgi:hypothetical protein